MYLGRPNRDAMTTAGQNLVQLALTIQDETLRLPLRTSGTARTPSLVLLLEDSPDLRSTLRNVLHSADHSVIEATSVDEARALVADLPEISAVLPDIVLEGPLTGRDLADAPHRDDCPLVPVTSLPPDDPLTRAGSAQTLHSRSI